jgi:hypothetical protein
MSFWEFFETGPPFGKFLMLFSRKKIRRCGSVTGRGRVRMGMMG